MRAETKCRFLGHRWRCTGVWHPSRVKWVMTMRYCRRCFIEKEVPHG